MEYRFALFAAASALAHLALLGTGNHPATPRIGGHAQALQVTLASSPSAPQAPTAPHRQMPASGAAQVATVRETSVSAAAPASVAESPLPQATPTNDRESMPVTEVVSSPRPAAAATQHAGIQISAALQNHLAKNFSYPWLARKRGWQGLVTLSLHIEKNGDLTRWKVAHTSGYPVLDRSALDSARRIERLPEAVGLFKGSALELLVPVDYRLLDS